MPGTFGPAAAGAATAVVDTTVVESAAMKTTCFQRRWTHPTERPPPDHLRRPLLSRRTIPALRRRVGDILGRIGAVLDAPPEAGGAPRAGEQARESEKPPEPEGSSDLSRRTIRRGRDPSQIERARRAAAQPMTSSTGR